MVFDLIKKLVGTRNDREIKRIQGYVDAVNALEEEIKALSDDQIKAKTPQLKDKLANGSTFGGYPAPRHLQWSAKPVGGRWKCVLLMCRL